MECIKCKTIMFQVKLNGDLYGTRVYLTNKKKGLLESQKRSNVTCFVCPNCGYIELKADNPTELQLS